MIEYTLAIVTYQPINSEEIAIQPKTPFWQDKKRKAAGLGTRIDEQEGVACIVSGCGGCGGGMEDTSITILAVSKNKLSIATIATSIANKMADCLTQLQDCLDQVTISPLSPTLYLVWLGILLTSIDRMTDS